MTDMKDAASVRVFPPALPVLTIVLGVGFERLLPIDLGMAIPAPARYWLGGIIAAGAILGLGLWSVLLFRTGGQSENPWKPTLHIVQKGPFRLTRNPMYLQMILVCIGAAIAFVNWWILLLTPVCVWALQQFAILPEEAYLERKFGDAYRSYQRKVRRWL